MGFWKTVSNPGQYGVRNSLSPGSQASKSLGVLGFPLFLVLLLGSTNISQPFEGQRFNALYGHYCTVSDEISEPEAETVTDIGFYIWIACIVVNPHIVCRGSVSIIVLCTE